MMLIIAAAFLVVIYVVTTVRIFYDFGVLPSFRDEARFKLFAIRDDLRKLGIKGQVDETSFAVQYFEARLNAMARLCSYHSVSNMIYILAMAEVPIEKIRLRERFDEEAVLKIKEMDRDATQIMMKIMFRNSPLFCVLATLVHLAASVFKTAQSLMQLIEKTNRQLVHEYLDYLGVGRWTTQTIPEPHLPVPIP